MTFGKELIQSANEALAIAQRRAEPAAVFVPESIDVAAIRKRLKLSQAEFAKAVRPARWHNQGLGSKTAATRSRRNAVLEGN
ncbi:hypothetical protein [Brucella pseudogrignonensis]|uniref:hypothetical protein n=1 Tax=Brucella pseudogrignonensis TaxID=419475 RepID=UPI001F15B1C8|nr:hypothetical protein [Brucella pseudogrignonensis]